MHMPFRQIFERIKKRHGKQNHSRKVHRRRLIDGLTVRSRRMKGGRDVYGTR
ncbi:hypothetical protein BGW80DRAFT_1305605 [Lactifluus volemus]|nr:hypothetical protein BGW80DRAFT_1305605 [Lactifluus volemus]